MVRLPLRTHHPRLAASLRIAFDLVSAIAISGLAAVGAIAVGRLLGWLA